MPRKSIDIRLTEYPFQQKKGHLRPFPAFRRGRVRAEPENGSRDWSLVGGGATPQSLKLLISAIFKVRMSLFFSAQFFIDYLTLPILIHCFRYPDSAGINISVRQNKSKSEEWTSTAIIPLLLTYSMHLSDLLLPTY